METSQRTEVGINAGSLKQQSVVLPKHFAFLYKKDSKTLLELGSNGFDFLIKITI